MKKRFLKCAFMMTFCTMIASASYVTPVFAADSSTSKEAKAYTTPIKGVNSISLLEKVSIGGTNQWITVRGEDRRNPILLYLHGGPGHAEMGSNPRFKELEKRYVVVNWDQRGSGKSFSPNLSKETLNVDQFLSDTHEMVEMLKKRFGRERIYLVGHSWGSLLGMIEISRHPESFYAYVGVGQFVDVTQGDRMGYDYTLNKAREVGNVAAIKELEGIGPPPYDSFDTFLAYRKWLIAMGGVFYSPTYIQDMMIPDIRNASEYTEAEKENHEMGEGLLTSTVIPELPEYNLLNQIHEVKVPVYFVAGKADYNTPLKLVEKLNQQLVAPHKELFLFEKSGHAPNYEEEQKFAQIMNQYVFNKTYYNPVADKPVRILLNGKDVNLKHELSDGQLMLPLRHTMEELGATIKWEDATNTVLVTTDRVKAILTLDSAVAKSDNQEVELATPASLVEGSTYVTVQVLEEVFHLQVDWNPATNEMFIFSK